MINMSPNEFIPKQTFTANGTFDMGQAPSNILHLKVDGNFGGASLQIGYVASNGDFVQYNVIPTATGNMQHASLFIGFWSGVVVKITAATASTSINVTWHPDTSDNHNSNIFYNPYA
jgi:hypothetical protein